MSLSGFFLVLGLYWVGDMCRVTETGDQCLRAWGLWAGRDGTVRKLGYPGRSAEQMAGHVVGGDYAVCDVELMVDALIVGMLEDRKRFVARFFYVDRLKISEVVERVKSMAKSGCESMDLGRISVDVVKRDLDVMRSMVGGVALYTDKKLLT